MKLTTAHEMGVSLSCTLALLAVLLGGELPLVAWGALFVPVASAYLRVHGRSVPLWSGTLIAAFSLLTGLLTLAQRGVDAALLAGGISLTGILSGRLLSREPIVASSSAPDANANAASYELALTHDVQSLLLSLLLVFAGSVLHTQLSYGVVFVFYAIAVTWALVTRQLIAGAQRLAAPREPAALRAVLSRTDVTTPRFFAATGGVAVVILLSTLLVFLAFPRVGLGSLGVYLRGGARLPKDVSLTGLPRASFGDDRVVARVRGVPRSVFDRGLYLKAQIYDHLRSDGFTRTRWLADMPRSELTVAPGFGPLEYDVFVQPVTDDRLLTLGPVRRARVVGGGSANPSLSVRILGVGPGDELMPTSAVTGPMRYVVRGSISQPGTRTPGLAARPMRKRVREHFLKLPKGLDPRVSELARKWAGDLEGNDAKTESLRGFLLNNFSYTLTQPNASAPDPLAAFLFDDRRGHCEYFATAFAVLLRAAGVPSRVVGGYQGGSWEETGEVVVFTGSSAHAWVEWHHAQRGWQVDDATPAVSAPRVRLTGLSALVERLRRVWDDHIVDYGLHEQIAMLRAVTNAVRSANFTKLKRPSWPVTLGVAAIVLSLLLFFGRYFGRRRRRHRRLESPLCAALLNALKRLGDGDAVPPTRTLREAVTVAAPHASEEGAAVLWRALQVYEAQRFGPRDCQDAVELLAALRRLHPA